MTITKAKILQAKKMLDDLPDVKIIINFGKGIEGYYLLDEELTKKFLSGKPITLYFKKKELKVKLQKDVKKKEGSSFYLGN